MSRTVSADALPQIFKERLRPGMRVFVSGGANEPHGLLDALRAVPEACAGVTFMQSIVPGLNRTDFCALHPEARITSFFMTPETQDAYREGRVDFVPMQIRVIPDYLADHPVDLALFSLADAGDGMLSVGLNADYTDVLFDTARCLVTEANRQIPAPVDARQIARERFECVLECDRPLAEYPLVTPTAEAEAIGRHVAGLIRDGDCLQTGIGAIPYAVLAALTDKNDLGLHSGLLDDGGWKLAARGVVTGRAKPIDTGLIVAGTVLGSPELYAWAGSAREIAMRPFSYTHDPQVLASLDNLVSVNSAMEVDFSGQINSETIRGRQMTGTGGSVDFIRGAGRARGGRSIIALTATAGGGKLSRILPRLAEGSATTALRTDIDYVVTEYGVAHLRYLPLHERARALIAIAHPDFRNDLEAQAREMFPG